MPWGVRMPTTAPGVDAPANPAAPAAVSLATRSAGRGAVRADDGKAVEITLCTSLTHVEAVAEGEALAEDVAEDEAEPEVAPEAGLETAVEFPLEQPASRVAATRGIETAITVDRLVFVARCVTAQASLTLIREAIAGESRGCGRPLRRMVELVTVSQQTPRLGKRVGRFAGSWYRGERQAFSHPRDRTNNRRVRQGRAPSGAGDPEFVGRIRTDAEASAVGHFSARARQLTR